MKTGSRPPKETAPIREEHFLCGSLTGSPIGHPRPPYGRCLYFARIPTMVNQANIAFARPVPGAGPVLECKMTMKPGCRLCHLRTMSHVWDRVALGTD